MIALDHLDKNFRPGWPATSWNEETWFQDLSVIEQMRHAVPTHMVRIGFIKPADENPIWEKPENRSLDVTPEQEMLMEDGSFKQAQHLAVGDHLMNMCGNGHFSQVEFVEPIEPRDCAAVAISKHRALCIRGGVIARSA